MSAHSIDITAALEGLASMPTMLDENGILNLFPAATYDSIPVAGLQAWCLTHARYGLPTAELIGWLKWKIGPRSAIEIGSGNGDLAHHLGIIGTDSKMQTWPDVQLLYKMSGQPTIQYPRWVEQLSASEALAKYQPEVVVASWVTQWTGENDPVGQSSMYGVREEEILATGATYILIGNESVHGHKRIMGVPHEVYDVPFVKSRAKAAHLNRVWVWNE